MAANISGHFLGGVAVTNSLLGVRLVNKYLEVEAHHSIGEHACSTSVSISCS